MKLQDILSFKKPDNKYDLLTRAFYLVFYVAGLIVFVSVGLEYMTPTAWVLGFVCSVLGATAYGTIAKMIVDMVRKDRERGRADILIRLFYVVFFALATVVFLTVGVPGNSAKTWIIAFIASYGAAFIYSTIARLIVNLARKDK